MLRCLNRMNDLVRGFRFKGHVHFRGKDIYGPSVDPVAVRRHIGMVFQQPNPFAMSIYRNVTFGLRLNGFKGDRHEKVEQALRGGPVGRGQGQAAQERALPVRRPAAAAVHRPGHRHGARRAAMDEPCSALDPIATRQDRGADEGAEEAVHDRHRDPQLQQAKRVADKTGFLYVDTTQGGRTGYLVEFGDSKQIFENPKEKYTQEYIKGDFS